MKRAQQIIIAKSAGFCFGVRRAITLAEKTAQEKKEKIYTLGPLIHNPQEVRRLGKQGIASVRDPKALKDATLILRTHGIPAAVRSRLEKKDIVLVDATCPFVKRAQDIIKELSDRKKSPIIIVGERTHPEVVALVSYGKGRCRVVEKKEDLAALALSGDVAVVSQTTQTPKNFNDVLRALRKSGARVTAYNTICRATMDRQSAAQRLAKQVEVMFVVGGKNSGNTRRLAEICRRYTTTYHIETAAELEDDWFARARTVGITAGASTPDWIIHDVKCRINSIEKRHTTATI